MFVALAGVVGHRCVAGIFELARERTNGLVKNFRLNLVELVEERRPFSSISWNSRAFWIARTDCAPKVCTLRAACAAPRLCRWS
jgi:hypothetical protein